MTYRLPGAVFLACLIAPMAAVADEVAEGKALVEQYCASCHAIGLDDPSPLPDAPAFRELHMRYDVGFLAESLVEGIVTAHPEMPQFEFEPTQAEAIVSYLRTLEGHPWWRVDRSVLAPLLESSN